jgi:multidrug resistance efflux pump
MAPSLQPTAAAPRARRLVPAAAWLGVVSLAASVVIVAFSGGWKAHAAPSVSAAPSENDSTAKGGLRAVCFGYGDIAGGPVALYPTQTGRVTAVKVAENAVVEAGDVLFQIDDVDAKLLVVKARAALEAAQEQLAQAREAPAAHSAAVAAQKAAIDAAVAKVNAAKSQLERARNSFKQDIGPNADVKAAEALVRQAEAGVAAEKANLTRLESVDPRHDVVRAEKDVAIRQADLDRAEHGVQECLVKAPAKGSILRINVNVGETLGSSPRQPAMLFCPVGPRIIRAEVEQEFASRVHLGQTTNIEDDATGGGHWTGKVTFVSDWITHRRSITLEPMQFNDVRTLECIIEVDPSKEPLRIGQRVRVTIGG